MNNSVSYNIEDYTIGDLMDLFHLGDNYLESDVDTIVKKYLQSSSLKQNKVKTNFIIQARNILISAIQSDDSDNDTNTISTFSDIIEDSDNDNDSVSSSDEENIKLEKTTTKKHTLDSDEFINSYKEDTPLGSNLVNRKEAAYNVEDVKNEKFILNEKRLPVQETHNVEVVRGQLNPNLKNVTSILLNIDSQFRPDLNSSSSNFTFDLSDPLYKVLSYSIINFEIQHSWYVFDTAYGTDSFYLDTSSNDNTISIENGNYDVNTMVTKINDAIATIYGSGILTASYNSYTHKITLTNNSVDSITIVFNDPNNSYPSFTSEGRINYNLGWIMGFRNTSYTISGSSSITSEALVDTYGPKYLLLAIDDFNHNHINKGMITMSDDYTKIAMPSYYTPDLSLNDPNFRFDFETQSWVPSNLKESQAYTIQEIAAARQLNYDKRFFGSSNANIFARIYLDKKSNFSYVFNANSHMKFNARTFFGPVTIQRMKVNLYNDKGQLMNLNGMDFSFALLVEQLYQY